MQNQREFQIKGNTWGAVAVLVVALIALFFIARGVFWLLSILAPIMLIAALIIDYKVLIEYVKWLVALTRRNVLVGAGAIILSVIGYPIVFAILLGRALMNKKIKDIETQERMHKEGELVDFEELESRQPPVELPKEEEPKSGYDDMFKG